jgi:hypothetical protein
MQTYSDIIESFPREIQLPMLKLMDKFRDETLDTVKRSDFEELKGVLSALADRVSDLALGQNELTQAQKKSEEGVEDLTQAQKKTEEGIEELIQAQKKTEEEIEELTQAQKKTEEVLTSLVKEQKKIRKDFGGLSDSIGYTLENEAIRHLPGILQKDLGLEIKVMDRRFIEYPDGRDDEINIYGEGTLNKKRVYIIGESKSQLGRKDIDSFCKLLIRVSNYLRTKIIPVLVTHSVRPQIEKYAKKKIEGLRLYMSFQL